MDTVFPHRYLCLTHLSTSASTAAISRSKYSCNGHKNSQANHARCTLLRVCRVGGVIATVFFYAVSSNIHRRYVFGRTNINIGAKRAWSSFPSTSHRRIAPNGKNTIWSHEGVGRNSPEAGILLSFGREHPGRTFARKSQRGASCSSSSRISFAALLLGRRPGMPIERRVRTSKKILNMAANCVHFGGKKAEKNVREPSLD